MPTTPPPAIRSWKLGATGRIEGSRTKVRQMIIEDKTIPDVERAYLVAKIDSRPADHNWIIILAHSQEHDGRSSIDMDIESSAENI